MTYKFTCHICHHEIHVKDPIRQVVLLHEGRLVKICDECADRLSNEGERMSKTTTSYGAYLSTLIDERNWSQDKLARFFGVSRQTVKSVLDGAIPRPKLSVYIEGLYDSGFTYDQFIEQATAVRSLELKAKWLRRGEQPCLR